jgi:hypothetical protein
MNHSSRDMNKTTSRDLTLRPTAIEIHFAFDDIESLVPWMEMGRRPSAFRCVVNQDFVTSGLIVVGEDGDALGEDLAGSNGTGIGNDQILTHRFLLLRPSRGYGSGNSPAA